MLTKDSIVGFARQSIFEEKRDALTKDDFKKTIIQFAQQCSRHLVGEEINIEMDIVRPYKRKANRDITWNEKLRRGFLTAEQKRRFEVYHFPKYIHLSYNKNKPGIELLGDIVHELEHERQYRGLGYSPEEYKMCCVAQFYYKNPAIFTRDYQNNYVEVFARIAETNLYLDVFKMAHTSSWSIQDRQTYCDTCESLLQWMKKHLDYNASTSLLTYYADRIAAMPIAQLSEVFPNIQSPTEQDRQEVLDFLSDSAIQLVHGAYDRCKEMLNALNIVITELRQQIDIEQHPPTPEQLQLYIKECAEVYHIPFIEHIQLQSAYLRCIPLDVNTFHDRLQYATKHLETPVLTYDNANQLCIVFQSLPAIEPIEPPSHQIDEELDAPCETFPINAYNAEFDDFDER